MATAFTHAFVALAGGKACYAGPMPWKFWVLAMACSAGPDLDVGLFAYGVEYEDVWGHRGMMHSVFFALLVAVVVVSVFFREIPRFTTHWWGLIAFFTVMTSSHGFIDAFTNGGLGIAFFAPFDNTRYFFPWQPIEVSHFGLTSLFTRYGLEVMLSEVKWVWLPSSALVLVVWLVRKLRSRSLKQAHSTAT